MNGKYDHRHQKSFSQPPSQFERDTLQPMKKMCAASRDENGFVMSYDEAYNLIKENSSGSMQITEDFKIGDWQTLKYIFDNVNIKIIKMIVI